MNSKAFKKMVTLLDNPNPNAWTPDEKRTFLEQHEEWRKRRLGSAQPAR